MTTFLWVIFPYIALAVFVVGLVWRYRHDKFGWTTRSSQFYETRMLRIASPLFHFGVLLAIVGHVMGLVIPKAWTDTMGISQHTYHLVAVVGGWVAGIMVVAGFALLVLRRITVPTVFKATSVSDKVMYLVMGFAIATGVWNTLSTTFNAGYNYRDGVSPWFRSIFTLQPDASLIADAPISFQVHALVAFALFLIWPFTRLVHVFSAPLGYLTRPYVVYRSAGDKPDRYNRHKAPAGTWDRASTSPVRR
ncbi:respiratory nitrate reductase subunit gamma [uncultured Tessaracoccus sp.]|uniref:respiratory nitrate reductase subunit gamma n=1 Tax=uncultured Tessaracoccus sp. TaxID=905023 RepID=UPI0025DD8B06|nr:respiratory nitrate reductase subunit gamma [uncultured Tessaracoccus sp.]